jgi:hypothetical protein
MKKLLTRVILGVAALLLIGGGLLLATGEKSGCPHGCCTGPDDCPTPSCCARK